MTMNDPIVIILVAAVVFVFVGSFIATLVIPNYNGEAYFAPVMTSLGGVILGVALTKRNGKNGTGK